MNSNLSGHLLSGHLPGHLNDEQLLRMLDGEVSPDHLASVRGHVEACWSCRARLREMEQAITHLIAWRNKELETQEPPPAAGRQRLVRALVCRHEGNSHRPFSSLLDRVSVLKTAFESNRARYFSAAFAAAFTALLVFLPLAHPPRITAAVFFERARLARKSPSMVGSAVVYERIEVRYGKRVLEHGITFRPDRKTPAEVASWVQSADWLPAFENGPVSWEDPMGVEAFERWHDRLESKTDTIEESPDSITLRTEPTSRDKIAHDKIAVASLVVRKADWRPIAKQISFSAAPALEVRQISYEVLPNDAPEEATSVAVSAPAPVRQPPQSAEAALDRSEIALREALYRLGADRNEIPEILRADGILKVRAAAETPERRSELLAAVQSIDLVHAEITNTSAETALADPGTPASGETPAPTPVSNTRVYSTTPPLAKELWDYMHGMDAANQYLSEVRESYFAVLPTAKALQRLSDRYSGPGFESLTPDVRARVNQLAANYITRIQQDAAAYLMTISSPLDEMLRRSEVPVSGSESGGGARCESWQALSRSIVIDLETLHTTFRRLFVVEQTEEPVTLSGPSLLNESARTRAHLLQALSELCAKRDRGSDAGDNCPSCQ